MTPELWKKVKATLGLLDSLPADRREAELARLRQNDPELAAEVVSLLQQRTTPPTPDEQPASPVGQEAVGGEKTHVPLEGNLGQVIARVLASVPLGNPSADPDSIPPDVPGCQLDGGEEDVRYGGMGVVYFGTERELRRPVAVKVLRRRLAADRVLVARFRDESLIAAQLQHPGIVPVYAIGQLGDGRPYCTMKLVRGETFSDVLKRRPTPLADLIPTLAIFRRVCEALGYAHGKRIIHRDLKPGNVMVGAHDEVLLVDWGLAKKLGDRSTAEPTPEPLSRAVVVDARTGGLETQSGLGSLPYLAPEQAAGRMDEVDERSDVFGLGAILCVILTGQPPYIGPTEGAIERKALRADLGEAYERLDQCGADPELSGLAKRCLAKDRADRPADGSVVANLVAAYVFGVEERLRQEALDRKAAEVRIAEEQKRRLVERQKRRVTLGLSTVAIIIMLVGIVVSSLFAIESKHQADLESIARQDADNKTRIASIKEKDAQNSLQRALAAEKEAEGAVESERQESYTTGINLAWNDYLNGRINQSQNLLNQIAPNQKNGQKDRRDFEWYYLWKKANGEDIIKCIHSAREVVAVGYSPDDSSLYSVSKDGTIKVWDNNRGSLKSSIQLNLGGGFGFNFEIKDGTALIKSVAAGGAAASLPEPLKAGDRILAIKSENGGWIELKNKTVAVIQSHMRGEPGTAAVLNVLRSRHMQPQEITLSRRPLVVRLNMGAATMSLDCRLLATVEGSDIAIWDVLSGRLKQQIPGAGGIDQKRLVFSPDGRFLTEHGDKQSRRVWETSTGKGRLITAEKGLLMESLGFSVAFTHDSRFLIQGRQLAYAIWPLDESIGDNKPRLITKERYHGIYLTTSPDGQWLASFSDEEIYIYDLKSGILHSILTCNHRVNALVFSPDGRLVAAGNTDGTIQLWHVARSTELATLRGLNGGISCISFRPDGKSIAASGSEGAICIWSLAQLPDNHIVLRGHGKATSFTGAVAFARDNKTCLVASSPYHSGPLQSGKAILDELDYRNQGSITPIQEDRRGVRRSCCSRNGNIVAALEHDFPGQAHARVRIWDAHTWQQLATIEHDYGAQGQSIALSPNGEYLAINITNYGLGLDPEHRKEDCWRYSHILIYKKNANGEWIRIATICNFQTFVLAMEFVGDTEKLAVAEFLSDSYSIWSCRTGRQTEKVAGLGGAIQALMPTPDGAAVAVSIGPSGAQLDKPAHILVREIETGIVRANLAGHCQAVSGLAFAPDGGRLASASLDGTIRIWDMQAKQNPQILRHSNANIYNVTFSSDGQQLFSTWMDHLAVPKLGGVTKWNLATEKEERRITIPDVHLTSVDIGNSGKTIMASGRLASGEWSDLYYLDTIGLNILKQLNMPYQQPASGHLSTIKSACISTNDLFFCN